MANPQIKLKRSATQNKRPIPDNIPLGELAINTYDGYLYASKDVGAGTTIITINPWRVGTGTDSFNIDFTAGNVGINSSIPTALLDVNGDVNISGVSTFNSTVNATDIIKGYKYTAAPYGSTTTITVTVASKTAAHRYNGTGSSSGYVFDGLESPFITLTPGRTYKFDQADNSNSSHQIKFYLEADKTTLYEGGVTYNGSAGSAGAYTQIVVGDDTPTVLHYMCVNHAYMGNSAQVNSNVVNTNYEAILRGNLNVSGIATATTFSGSGASLTTLNASELDSGTIPDARFPATLPAASGANLTTLNASELDSGTIPDARFPATLPAASGANLTNLPAANITGTLPAISGANLTGVVTSITAGSNITLTGGPTGSITIAAAGGSGGDTVSIESSATDILSVSSGAISADDAGADKLVFWDDSAGKLTYLTVGSNLTVTDTTIAASGGGGGGGAIGIQSGGTEITSSAGTINFVGTGITMADDGSVTDITIPSATRTTNRYIATANQTTFSATYTVGYVDVFLNGIKLDGQDEFTATNGTSVVLTDGATVNDIVEIVAQQISANLTITGISNVVEDTTPQLGGDLDVNGKNISGTGDVNLTGIVTATTFSGGTFSGNVDLSGLLKEGVNITAGKLSDNTGIDLANGMVHLFTTEETTTSTPNLVFGGSSVNAKMSIGEAITVVIITTADATGYSAELTIDSSAVTEEWLGGEAPSEGGAGGYDVYTHNIIKTADATYVVLSNLVNFA